MPHTLQVSTLKDGTIHWILRTSFSFITWQGVDVKRVQFPVRLCSAVTVPRSGGQTLNRVVFNLRRDISCTDAYIYMSAYPKTGNPPTLEFDNRG